MPWISRARLVEMERRQAQTDRALLGMVDGFTSLPARVVAALRELPAKVLAPVVDQPPSIAVADKRRVAEARDREKETR